MSYALSNRVKAEFGRELHATRARAMSRLHDPSAASVLFRPFEKCERLARAEEAQSIVEIVRRDPQWRRDARLDQWVERIWCTTTGGAAASGATGAQSLGPVDVLGGASTIVGYLQGELGITISTGVSAWASQIGGTTLDMAQATGANQPAYSANNALFWGRATVTGDGSNDFMTNAWDPAAPATTPAYLRFATSRSTHVLSARLTAGFGTVGGSVADTMRASLSSTGNNVAMSLNTLYRVEVLFTNSASDYFNCGSAGTTGARGNTDVAAGAVSIFATSAGAGPSTHSISKMLVLNAGPSTLQRALLDAIDSRFYNGNISL